MRKFLSMIFLLATVMVLHAQQRTVTGTVRDENGEPVGFVTVTETGTKNAVQANEKGEFSINIAAGSAITFSATGFDPQTTIATGNSISITLQKADQQMQQVVVTALGQSRQAKQLGYATARVKSSELTQGAPVNLQNGLTAKVSGLNINTTNNGVFAQTRITLRGIRSLTGNNQPMLILDGVPIALSFLNSINPNDVADVNILKSSSATTVYGPDGVNGAIVVTTKRGIKGKPQVTLSHNTQLESISYMPEFQTMFGSGYTQDINTGYGTFDSIEQQSWGAPFDGVVRQMGQDGPNGEKLMLPYSYVKNGRRNFFNTGVTHQTNLSYSTGDFYISAQNVNIKGVMPGDENNRRTFTLRADKEYGRFKAGFNLRYTNSQYDVTYNNATVYYGITGSPGQYDLARFRDWKNDYFSSPDGYYTPYLDNNGKTPYFAKDNWRDKGSGNDIFGNGELNLRATDWLNFTYRVGVSLSNAASRRTRGAFDYSAYHRTLRDAGSNNITAAVNDATTYNGRITSEFFVNLNKKFKDFGISALLGQSYREITSRFLSAGSDNLGSATIFTPQLRKGEAAIDRDNSQSRLERYFGKISLDYNNWAFIEATGSYDIDSRLVKPGTDFKKSDIAFFYPGISTSLVLSDAIPALNQLDFLSYLKLRGSLSKTGNVNLSPYAFQNIFYNGVFFPYGNNLGFQVEDPATGTAVIASDSYKPEFVINKEVGIEMGFFNNRVNIEATYYNQNNTDQIINVEQSITTGATTSRQNAASFINKGLELDLRLTPLVRLGKVDIDFKVNYTHQTNKVTKIVDGVNELGIGNFNYAIVGQPAFVFKLTDYVRDDQGRVIVDRVTGMPSQNPNLTQFGRTMPEHILGLNLNVNWKGLSFSAVVDYRGGNQIVADQLGAFLDDNGISKRTEQHGRRAFVWPNSVYNDGTGKLVPNTDVYTQTYGRLLWNSDLVTEVKSNYLANGAFWKLRELALNYDLPAHLFNGRFGSVVKGIAVGINGRNLLMFLPKSNQWTDPEFSASGNNAYTGNAVGRSTAFNMPPTRIFGANVAVRF